MMPTDPRAARLVWAGFAALALVLVRRTLLGEVLFERDVHLVWLAQVEAFKRALGGGAWPLWDPETGFGQPMLANPSAQVLYPPHWLTLALAPWTSYAVYSVLHLAIAGSGACALARRLGLPLHAAALAGALYMGSGPVVSLVNVWHHLAGAALMPWVLYALLCALAAPRTRTALSWSAVPALQVLAGSPDLCAMTMLVAPAVIAPHFEWRRPAADANRRSVVRLTCVLGLAAALSAGQWIPTLESALGSARFEMADAKRTFWSLHPVALLQMVAPVSLEALPRQAGWVRPLFELWSPFLESVYLGLAAGLLAVVGLARGGRPAGRLALTGAAALLFALGPRAPVHAVMTTLVPPLGLLRYPSKAMAVVALAVALLAGLGWQAWRSGGPVRRRAVLGSGLLLVAVATMALAAGARAAMAWAWPVVPAVVLAAAVVALLVRPASARAAPALVAALAVGDLAFALRAVNATTSPAFYAARPELLDALPSERPLRVHVWDYVMPVPGVARRSPARVSVLGEDPPGLPRPAGQALAMQAYLYPPAPTRWGVSGSFDPDLLDLGGRLGYDVNLMVRAYEGTTAYARLMEVGAVDRVVALHDEGFPGLERVAQVKGLYSQPIRVFRVPAARPRAYLVSGARIAGEPDSYRLLVRPEFDPAREVILADGAARPPDPAFAGSARVTERRSDRLRVEIEASGPAWLTVVEAWAPGWRARVDGREAPLVRANVLFRAVAVDAGRHVVEMSYRPPGVAWGFAVSGVALLALVGLLATAAGAGRGA